MFYDVIIFLSIMQLSDCYPSENVGPQLLYHVSIPGIIDEMAKAQPPTIIGLYFHKSQIMNGANKNSWKSQARYQATPMHRSVSL